MKLTRFGQIVVGLVAFGIISSAWGWEPREPEGVRPLNAERIRSVLSGKIGRGKLVAFEERYYEDGVLQGVTSNGRPFSGKWWMEEKDDYLCMKYVFRNLECSNIARGEDGMLYYYVWGSDRPDYDVKLEDIPD